MVIGLGTTRPGDVADDEDPQLRNSEFGSGRRAAGLSRSQVKRRSRSLLSITAGITAGLAALVIPFLPVQQDQSRISWPQSAQLTPIAAPLVSYAPTELAVRIPCPVLERVAGSGGAVVSTIPAQSASAERYGFVAKVVPGADVRDSRLDVVSRNTLLWSTPLHTLRGTECSIAVESEPATTKVEAYGAPDANAAQVHKGDLRPQVVGVFTDLVGAAPDGLHVDLAVDSRFSSSPSALKLMLIVLCLLSTATALVALHHIDRTDGRASRRWLPGRWWSIRPVDAVVAATLAVWHFIGANTSDDGYQLGMARASNSSGYMANFFRWFGVPESPFGTPYYDLLAWMAKVSTASPWMRLPALVAGLVIWWIVSREVIPRLGAAARRNRVVVWTAALVFLVFWLPYNNGLRPEPMEALGVLLTWVSMERAIATKRLLPAAVALLTAAVTLTVGPAGLICFAPLVAGARGLAQIVVMRAHIWGYPALLAPLVATGMVVLSAVFADQTLATVLEMVHVHGAIGPGEPWFFEYLRYQYLLQINSDGWLTRRFGVFVLILGIATCLVTMLRRGGHIPGTATGPALRLIGIALGAMVLMMFTPTKWTHHFGVYAGLAAAVAALTAVAVGPAVMRPLRNRSLFAAAVFFALAMSFVGANGYWYVSSWGIPWWDKPPAIAGIGLSSVAAALTVAALAAATWLHIRPPRNPEKIPRHRLARVPILAVVAAVMVAFEVLSFGKAAAAQYPAYSLTKSNLAATFAGGCGLADEVLVETDPNASMLTPVGGDVAGALTATGSTGFTSDGVGTDLTSEEIESTTGRANSVSDAPVDQGSAAQAAGSGTATSRGVGINGSAVPLPFGLDPATTPVAGSYRDHDQGPAELVTDWYRLPTADSGRDDLIAIAVSGRIRSTDADGVVRAGQPVLLEYGRTQSDGSIDALGRTEPIDIGPAPAWRNLRVPLDRIPTHADVIRVTASDKDLSPEQWLAVTPPRVPRTQTLDQLVGTRTPVLLDWAVGLNFPCQNLIGTHAGVAQVPQYRILPDRNGATITNLWQGHDGGGPLGWTQLLLASRELPSYLDHDWDRDWGSIEQYTPIQPGTQPAAAAVEPTDRSGLWTPGHINTRY
ncbi:arabinosyltransferase domain-containing protein [Nocardia rhamnosiphila]